MFLCVYEAFKKEKKKKFYFGGSIRYRGERFTVGDHLKYKGYCVNKEINLFSVRI